MRIIMSNKFSSDKKILLDCDVISHFIKGEKFDLLAQMFPGRLILLDIVKKEVCQRPRWDSKIEELILKHGIMEVTFPNETEYVAEYAHLISRYGLALGKGESACMVYCRFNSEILASSNLTDIHRYCSMHSIEYITTADILYDGYINGLITEVECDLFISRLHERGSKIPFKNMRELIRKLE